MKKRITTITSESAFPSAATNDQEPGRTQEWQNRARVNQKKSTAHNVSDVERNFESDEREESDEDNDKIY